MIKLICALGNPGDQYAQTRHNAGFWFLGKLSSAENFGLSLNSRFKSLVGDFRHNTQVVRVIAPQTYMNKSGEALVPFAKFYQVAPEEILVVHDEIDLLPGITRFKTGGGHGGHNGLRDIVRLLGSKDFHRLRVGVGHPGDKSKVVSYVLNRPGPAEAQLIDAGLDKALAVLPKILEGDFAAAMNELHTV
ncbi:MAG: aminoacyl-tRNA hydrolase [Proteobacteria bacterium]|nr:aminoacyl-tRNA hydrolase [Pseudomonadota bacterium]